jgi:hypothetical protein
MQVTKITIYLEGSVRYVNGHCLLYDHHSILWHLCPVCQGLWEVLAMLADMIVGLIGVVLIIYLLVTVIRPELF